MGIIRKNDDPTSDQKRVFERATAICSRNRILREQSSSCRRAWVEGFTNGYLLYKHEQPAKKKWYFLWLK